MTAFRQTGQEFEERANVTIAKQLFVALSLCASLCACASTPTQPTQDGQGAPMQPEALSVDQATIDTSIYLDYQAGIDQGVYGWVAGDDATYYVLAALDKAGDPISVHLDDATASLNLQELQSTDGIDVYQGVYLNANITNPINQTMLIYVPAAYLATDNQGRVTGIDHTAVVDGYTADTAPIVYANHCSGWRSSTPHGCDPTYLERGMVYVSAGARSRDLTGADGTYTGKAPMPIADLKSGVMALHANAEVIPGDEDRIVSVGRSGGGEMSSVLGASGNMPAYLPYLYEAGTLGVTKTSDGTYHSTYPDNIFAAQCYCPIADIEYADLAFAWWWVDLVDDGGILPRGITPFEERLQQLEAEAFIGYLNGLELRDDSGNPLTLTGLRSGSYYEATLANLSDALNASVAAGEIDPAETYPRADWLEQRSDGGWKVTDLEGFMVGTGVATRRGKDIPGFDTFDRSADNSAFGSKNVYAPHFARSVAQVLSDHYDELSALEGFDASVVDPYIEEALTGEGAEAISEQVSLMNATGILLGNNGLSPVDPAPYWRVRSGTADEHTSFSIGYNLCLAARMQGLNADYALIWDMPHGNDEGSSTGTLADWIEDICPKK